MERSLSSPLKDEAVRELKVGEVVKVTGTVFTARDMAHRWLCEGQDEFKAKLRDSVIYHCGPIVRKDHTVVSAGPTTSIRLDEFEPVIIKNYGIRGIIGKGGMGERMLETLKKHGCVYLHAVGGAGALIGSNLKVKDVYKLEFGIPEAIWQFQVKELTCIVTMDAHGRSLHKKVLKISEENLRRLEDED